MTKNRYRMVIKITEEQKDIIENYLNSTGIKKIALFENALNAFFNNPAMRILEEKNETDNMVRYMADMPISYHNQLLIEKEKYNRNLKRGQKKTHLNTIVTSAIFNYIALNSEDNTITLTPEEKFQNYLKQMTDLSNEYTKILRKGLGESINEKTYYMSRLLVDENMVEDVMCIFFNCTQSMLKNYFLNNIKKETLFILSEYGNKAQKDILATLKKKRIAVSDEAILSLLKENNYPKDYIDCYKREVNIPEFPWKIGSEIKNKKDGTIYRIKGYSFDEKNSYVHVTENRHRKKYKIEQLKNLCR